MPTTATDEHRDGLVAGHARRGRAEHDQAAVDQQRRLGRAFRPLSTLTPVFLPQSKPVDQPAGPDPVERQYPMSAADDVGTTTARSRTPPSRPRPG